MPLFGMWEADNDIHDSRGLHGKEMLSKSQTFPVFQNFYLHKVREKVLNELLPVVFPGLCKAPQSLL